MDDSESIALPDIPEVSETQQEEIAEFEGEDQEENTEPIFVERKEDPPPTSVLRIETVQELKAEPKPVPPPVDVPVKQRKKRTTKASGLSEKQRLHLERMRQARLDKLAAAKEAKRQKADEAKIEAMRLKLEAEARDKVKSEQQREHGAFENFMNNMTKYKMMKESANPAAKAPKPQSAEPQAPPPGVVTRAPSLADHWFG